MANVQRDKLFLTIITILVSLIVIYALVTGVILIIAHPTDTTILRFISSFGTIFAGILGLCSGYLIGQTDKKDEK